MTWMAWTVPTGAFFTAIALLLLVYSVWGVRSPSLLRRGFLPMATTRGDRLFVGLLGSAYISLLWVGLTDTSPWFAATIWLPWMVIVGRWG
jgi:predicted small integral membrane protein